MADAVRSAVVAELDVAVAAVHFTRRGGIPRTTSGKLRRQACRDAWLQGALPPLATAPESAGPVAPVTAGAARDLRAVLAAVTRLSRDALDDSTGPLRRPADPAGRRGRHRGTATSRRMAPLHHRHPHRPPVDGIHHSMLRRPALTALATAVDRCLTPDTEPTPNP